MRIEQHIYVRGETVTIALKNPHQKLKRELRCIYCGNFLIATYKEVALIIEGAGAPVEAITAQLNCTRCKTSYEIC